VEYLSVAECTLFGLRALAELRHLHAEPDDKDTLSGPVAAKRDLRGLSANVGAALPI